MDVEQICAWLEQFPGVMVEITGGEPLLQKAVYPLMEKLLAQGRQVLLETGGSLSIMEVPNKVGVILDVKCPGSGMAKQNEPANIQLLRQRQAAKSQDEVKFVLSSEQDVIWANQFVQEHNLTELVPVLFSPVAERLSPTRLAELMLQQQLPIRLQLQLHTQIWPGVDRGA